MDVQTKAMNTVPDLRAWIFGVMGTTEHLHCRTYNIRQWRAEARSFKQMSGACVTVAADVAMFVDAVVCLAEAALAIKLAGILAHIVLLTSPQAPHPSLQHPREAPAKKRNWLHRVAEQLASQNNTSLRRSSNHPFLDLRKIGSSSRPSQPLPFRPRDSQLLASMQAPRSSLQRLCEAPAELQKLQRSSSRLQVAEQSGSLRVDERPREAPLLLQNSQPRPREAYLQPQNSRPHPREARPAATQVPRASSIVVPSVQDIEMVNVEPIPSFESTPLKRPRSPSPSHGSNKRSRVESPCPSSSMMSRFQGIANFLTSPFKSGTDATRAVSPRTSSAPGPAPTGTSGRVSALPRTSSAPVSTRSPAPASAAAPTGASSGNVSASLIMSSAPTLVTDYRPASPALREGNVYRSEVLEKCNLVIHLTERVAICTKCEHGYLFGRACTHSRQIHNQKLARDELQELKRELLENGVAEHPEALRMREFGEAPIEGIAIDDGFVCDPYTTAWKDDESAFKHCNEQHGGDRSALRECKIQSVLHPKWKAPLRWVRVDPGMGRGGDSLAAYSAFQTTWGVKLRNKPIVIPGPVNDNGITLLASMTGWLIHLAAHIKTADGVAGLQFLTDTKMALKQQPAITSGKNDTTTEDHSDHVVCVVP
ncbi:hypothetical protein B0H10DRAFT_1948089 [Mycena sp. CBHHK59/15]|nr:hypothetical protein B0H10DRAFT_1948089 [Mycena sp. CBHHK59/15]